MTRTLERIGFFATLAITVIFVVVIINEPRRQDQAEAALVNGQIRQAVSLYVDNCAECHGARGEGFDINPALSAEHIRTKDRLMLYRSIERGRSGTDMAAFAITEGGNLTELEIESLVTLIREGAWNEVESHALAQNFQMPTATPTPTLRPTITPTPSPSTTPSATLSPTSDRPTTAPPVIPIVPAASTPTSAAPMFEVLPSATSAADTPDPGAMFQVLPTTGGAPSLFDVVRTATPASDDPFAVVPTVGNDNPFAVQPSATP